VPQKLGEIGQRAQLTIMFTDLSNSTSIASKMEPEQFSDLLDKIGDSFLKVVNQHGGEVIRIDGDGFIIVFGYPTPHKDCTRRAVDTALDLHEALEKIEKNYDEQGVRLRLHTGIHSGIVLLKQGDLARGRYEILGDPTNITARLCEFAAPGEIVISDEALGRMSIYFQISQQTLITLKGRSQKLLVKKVIGRNDAGDLNKTWASHSGDFVGRESELGWINNFVMSDTEDKSVGHIQAEAGMGKSRLLREFSNRMADCGHPTHLGICESYLGVKPYQPVRHILRSILSSEFGYAGKSLKNIPPDAPPAVNDFLKLINITEDLSHDIQLDTQDIKRAFTNLCQEIKQRKLILILDDWQWVDDASKSFIETLAKFKLEQVKIILASRVEDLVFLEMNEADSLHLKPLTSENMKEVIGSMVPGVEPFTLMRIEKHSGGNPLYIEELCHAINDSRFSFGAPKTGSWLKSLIFTRFSQLPEILAEYVKVASVIGYVIPEWLINELSSETLTAKSFQALRESDFLYPAETGDNIRFKHGITRDVVYEMIHLKERQKIHTRIIGKLSARASDRGEPEPHDLLAHHSKQAGLLSESIYHSRIAGEAALKKISLNSAQEHFKNALIQSSKIKTSEEDKLYILKKYGLSCVVDPSLDQLPILQSAAKQAGLKGNETMIAWSEYWLGNNLYGLGYPDRSIRHFGKAYSACQNIEDNKLETQLLANLGQAYAAAGKYATAYEYLDRAIDTKMRKRSGKRTSSGLAYAISCKGFALGEQGAYDAAMECFSSAIDVLAGSEHFASTSILNQRAVVNLWHGNYAEALRLSAITFEMSRRMHSRYNFAQSVFITAASHFKQTEKFLHIDKMIEASNWLVYDGTGQNMSLNYGAICDALTHIKDWDRARIYAARGLKRIRAGDKRCESQILRSLALISKSGNSLFSPEYYLKHTQRSAQYRQSKREVHNNEVFEKTHFG